MAEDAELLRQYVETGSEDAFTELVNRHLPLVYSTALRRTTGDAELAKDVAQSVFLALARKAGLLAGREVLAGWLYSATRMEASKACRGDHRRRARELNAATMHEDTLHLSREGGPGAWRDLLDEAMDQLDSEDRDAVLLRYFQDQELAQVGATLGISPDAARMRVNRSLQKLHGILSRRGVTLSAAALGMAIAADAVSAPPTGLVAAIAGAALAGKTATGGTAIALAKLFTMTKIQTAVIGVALIACAAIPLSMQYRAQKRASLENQALQEQVRQLAAENRRLSGLLARAASPASDAVPGQDPTKELLRLRGEIGRLKRQLADAEAIHGRKAGAAGRESDPEIAKYEDQFGSKEDFVGNLLRAIIAYEADHEGQVPPNLEAAAAFLNDKALAQTNWTAAQFEIVDPASCSVLTNGDWGVMIRERQPWHAFGTTSGRIYGWMQAGARRQATIFANEGDTQSLDKWEAQIKWEMDYDGGQQGAGP